MESLKLNSLKVCDMIHLCLFFVACFAMWALFCVWTLEQKRKRALLMESRTSKYQRQCLRYQNSSVFDTVLWTYNDNKTFQAFMDHFKTVSDVTIAMKNTGLHSCYLILGIDLTASNEWQGRQTFGGHSLHTLMLKGKLNPYQQVISCLGKTLEPLRPPDSKGWIHTFAFGTLSTRNYSLVPFRQDQQACHDFEEVLKNYAHIVRRENLAGPTSFCPLIHESIKIVQRSGNQFHILVIISDGQMHHDNDTVQALVEASHYPLSIIMVGVGDGPWNTMEEFDDGLPARSFDNFQFVDYHRALNFGGKKNGLATFALQALMEIPDQYKAVKSLIPRKRIKTL